MNTPTPLLSTADREALAALMQSEGWEVIKRLMQHYEMQVALQSVLGNTDSLFYRGQIAGRYHGSIELKALIEQAGAEPAEPEFEDDEFPHTAYRAAEYGYSSVE